VLVCAHFFLISHGLTRTHTNFLAADPPPLKALARQALVGPKGSIALRKFPVMWLSIAIESISSTLDHYWLFFVYICVRLWLLIF